MAIIDRRIGALSSFLALLAIAATPLWLEANAEVIEPQVISGSAQVEADYLQVQKPGAVLAIRPNRADFDASCEIEFGPARGPVLVVVMPSDPRKLASGGALRVQIGRDEEGLALAVTPALFDARLQKWTPKESNRPWRFWPAGKSKDQLADLSADGIAPRTWRNRWIFLRVVADRSSVAVWLDGQLAGEAAREPDTTGPVAIQLLDGDMIRHVSVQRANQDPLFLPIDLTPQMNEQIGPPLQKTGSEEIRVAGVPLVLTRGTHNALSLRQAQWVGWREDSPWGEAYNSGPVMLNDPRMPFLRVPLADYVAAHLLAVSDDAPQTDPSLTLRAGQYGGGSHLVIQHDFVGNVPRAGDTTSPQSGQVHTPLGPLYHISIPIGSMDAFAQDLNGPVEIELTKRVRIARRSPDPNRFRLRPLGLGSGVKIAALTLELSPLQMKVESDVVAHAFVQPQVPTFRVSLRNITTDDQPYVLELSAMPLDGPELAATRQGSVKCGKTDEVSIPLGVAKRGFYELKATLRSHNRILLCRKTSFALLPPDTRRHRDRSPFGTYDYGGAMDTSRDYDAMGPLYVKLGMRYGMFGAPAATRSKFGLVEGEEPRVNFGLERFEKELKRNPDLPMEALIFHEDGISAEHLTRIPDLFADRPRFQLSPKDQEHFQQMWDEAVRTATAFKQKYPGIHLRLGNGNLPLQEEFLRHKFPANLFDSLGNESGAYTRSPESQPCDWIANNAALWMQRQMLDAYGYPNKPVTQCHEVCYPGTNPAELDEQTQAQYFVRHAMFSLAWGVPEFRPGILTDTGDDYRFGMWGSSGFCHCAPEFNVKQSFVQFATMSWVLDGAKFVRVAPAGSPSLFVMEFERTGSPASPDSATKSSVYVIWTARGRRPVTFQFPAQESPAPWELIDDQANQKQMTPMDGRLQVTATESPCYLVGPAGTPATCAPGTPVYADRSAGQRTVLSPLADLSDLLVESGRNGELEYYNFLTPRRKGDFAFDLVPEFEGRGKAIRVTPRPIHTGKDTMPMYTVLSHKHGIPVPGQPSSVGLWINGNSSWGRVIFDLTDASGQRWISIGAQSPDMKNPWIDSIPRELLATFPNPAISDWNADDVWGNSRIDFDGWRYLAVPLPGNYPGEHFPWPANSQWRWDKDGVVHYPLILRKLVIELPTKTLHATSFAPAPRTEIYLKDLSVIEPKETGEQ